jgi:hypothetical protein
MTSDDLKICFIARNHGCTDATGCERNQDIEHQFSDLRRIIMFMHPDGAQHISCLQPVRFSWREYLASSHQVSDKPAFNSWSGSTQQFVQNYRRAANDMRRSHKTKGEATGPEILDVDGSIQNSKLTCLQRSLVSRPRCTVESPNRERPSLSPGPTPFESFRWWSSRQAPSWLVSTCRSSIWQTLEQEPWSTSCRTGYTELYDRGKAALGNEEFGMRNGE